jgi:hypothetical protein
MYTWWATAAFGLEGQVRRELQTLGLDGQAETGGVRFLGTAQDGFRANLGRLTLRDQKNASKAKRGFIFLSNCCKIVLRIVSYCVIIN